MGTGYSLSERPVLIGEGSVSADMSDHAAFNGNCHVDMASPHDGRDDHQLERAIIGLVHAVCSLELIPKPVVLISFNFFEPHDNADMCGDDWNCGNFSWFNYPVLTDSRLSLHRLQTSSTNVCPRVMRP
jgi:hypothetical protein